MIMSPPPEHTTVVAIQILSRHHDPLHSGLAEARGDLSMTVRRTLCVFLLIATAAPAFAQLAQTRVAQGALAGQPAGNVTAYLGVPFAAPPVGEYRWKPPRPAPKWQGERKADHFGASCQQKVTPQGFGPWTAEYVVQDRVSEDCLYLNVWTPARSANERLPVLFWIYGGGFSSGSGSVEIYDGAALARQGIIVVSANYRVGVYGFLAHPELTAESPSHASGNYGLLDQIQALHWIHDNIAAFGGDPARVTISGQSAGAASVHHLISSPLAKGLFAGAIAQSGSGMGIAVPDHAAAEAIGKDLSNVGGQPLTLAQLRKLSAAELDARVDRMMKDATGLRFVPVVDGLVLPDAATVGKNTNDTPILTGMTANEGTGMSPDYGKTTVSTLDRRIKTVYGKSATEFAALYPAKNDTEAWTMFDAFARDRGLASMYLWAKDRLPATRYPIYAYLWTHPEPGPEAARYRAFHSSEIPYVFGTLDTPTRPFTAADRALSKQVSAYWVNFVKTGDPNGQGLPKWPRLTSADKQILELGDHTRPRAIMDARNLAAFEHYQQNGGQLGLF
jgi:para-nitrobenzyl esterase